MVEDSIILIRQHLARPGVTKKALAQNAGLHPNTLRGVEDASWNPSASTLIAIERQVLADGATAEAAA